MFKNFHSIYTLKDNSDTILPEFIDIDKGTYSYTISNEKGIECVG